MAVEEERERRLQPVRGLVVPGVDGVRGGTGVGSSWTAWRLKGKPLPGV